MKNEQLETVLAVMADKIQSLEITITMKDYEIENLKAQLAKKNEEKGDA